MRRPVCVALLAFVFGMCDVSAQPREPEVRRAEPANPHATPAPYQTPTPYEPPTMRALPVDPVEEPITPATVPSATPVPTSSPAADPSTEVIRVAPDAAGDPQKMQIDMADGFYARKMFDLAAPEYEKYLREYSRGAYRETALFRLAECYLAAGKTKPARDIYETLLAEFQQGEFLGPASYRLGIIYYNDKNYKAALPLFQKAGSKTSDAKIAAAAKYNEARCLESLGRRNETIEVYTEITTIAGNNPYRDAARFALAQRFQELGRKNDALKQYEALVQESTAAEIRAEAAVRGAALASELGQTERAAVLYAQAAKTDGGGKWTGMGILGQLQALYEAGKYREVVRTYSEASETVPVEAQAQALLLVGNSQRQQGQFDGALGVYDRILREYPKALEAKEAAFQKLVCLYQNKSPDLQKEIDKFLAVNREGPEADQVRLLKAEMLFNADKFAEAGPLYLQLSTSSNLPKFRAEAVFKLGWCYAQVQQYDKAIEAYTMFVGEFPGHALMPASLVQRGLAFQKLKNYDRALVDYDAVILNHPKSKERELALQQKALIFGQKNDNAQMVASFQLLLRDYPKSGAAGQANYWIGWAEFEQKRYKEALEPLDKARTLDKAQYYDRATLRIILCFYYLDRPDVLTKEIDEYVAAKAMPPVPSEVTGWLGTKLLGEGKNAEAVKYLALSADGMAQPEVYLALGRALLDLDRPKEAIAALTKYLGNASKPAERAQGLLRLGEAQLKTKDFTGAKKSGDEVMLLQPEGRLNAEGRLLLADIEYAQGRYDAAGKAYMGVAVLYDDAAITPRALERAAESYRRANKTAEADKVLKELKERFPEHERKAQQNGQQQRPLQESLQSPPRSLAGGN